MSLPLNKMIKTTLIATLLLISAIQLVFAQSDQSRLVAMQIAESKTGGKSLRAKFVKGKDGQKGYRVRIMKNHSSGRERIVHVFVRLSETR